MVDPTDESFSPPAPRRRRSPLIDVAVAIFGTYLLVTMFGDVRYFLQGSSPRDLGDATTLVEQGLDDDLREQFVTLRGTPDVQHAARAKLGEKTIGYLRLLEGRGSLFAAVPRTGAASNQFEGQFTGRMRRLADVRMFPWVQQYFDGEHIVETRELGTPQLLAALDSGALKPDDQLSLSVDQPDARLQLGRNSFPSLAAAEAVVRTLGVPHFTPREQTSPAFYTIFARIPADQRAAAQTTLAAAAAPLPPEGQPDKPDSRVGVLVVPFFTTYLVPATSLRRDGDSLSFPVGDTSPGFIEQDGKLLPRPLTDGRLTVAAASLRGVSRIEPVRVDPGGYIIIVDEQPADQWPTFALWLVVLGVVGWNLTGLVQLWRRRQA